MNYRNLLEKARSADERIYRLCYPNQRRVLINAHTPMEYPVVAPIINALRNDRRITLYFTSTNEPESIRYIFREAGTEANLINPRRAALMKFDAYLATDMPIGRLARRTRRIQMFHGVAGKFAPFIDTPQKSMRHWYRLFFINRRRMRNWIQMGAIDENSLAARMIGMPKTDSLVDGSLERDKTLINLNLDPSRRTVLYAPTWSAYSSLNVMGEDIVRRLCDAGYTVIVKLHENSRNSRATHSGGVDWFERLDPTLKAGGGHMAKESNVCPYLAAADCLITDHSSVGFEYLLLDRPLVRVQMPQLLEKSMVNPEYVELLKQVSQTALTPAEVVRCVDESFASPRQQSTARKAVAEDLFYRPGGATARAVREIYKVIELEQYAQQAA